MFGWKASGFVSSSSSSLHSSRDTCASLSHGLSVDIVMVLVRLDPQRRVLVPLLVEGLSSVDGGGRVSVTGVVRRRGWLL